MDIGIEMDMNEERKHFLEKQQDDGHGNDTSASCTRRSSSTGHRGSSVDLGVGDEDNELRKLQAEQNRPRQMCRFSENERVRNIAAFWILGLLNNYGYVVMLSAAKDIDEKMAGLVLFADIIPTVLIKVTSNLKGCSSEQKMQFRLSHKCAINAGHGSVLGSLPEL